MKNDMIEAEIKNLYKELDDATNREPLFKKTVVALLLDIKSLLGNVLQEIQSSNHSS
jgi:hypothetical protein